MLRNRITLIRWSAGRANHKPKFKNKKNWEMLRNKICFDQVVGCHLAPGGEPARQNCENHNNQNKASHH